MAIRKKLKFLIFQLDLFLQALSSKRLFSEIDKGWKTFRIVFIKQKKIWYPRKFIL